jgi:hypothetical protein
MGSERSREIQTHQFCEKPRKTKPMLQADASGLLRMAVEDAGCKDTHRLVCRLRLWYDFSNGRINAVAHTEAQAMRYK